MCIIQLQRYIRANGSSTTGTIQQRLGEGACAQHRAQTFQAKGLTPWTPSDAGCHQPLGQFKLFDVLASTGGNGIELPFFGWASSHMPWPFRVNWSKRPRFDGLPSTCDMGRIDCLAIVRYIAMRRSLCGLMGRFGIVYFFSKRVLCKRDRRLVTLDNSLCAVE